MVGLDRYAVAFCDVVDQLEELAAEVAGDDLGALLGEPDGRLAGPAAEVEDAAVSQVAELGPDPRGGPSVVEVLFLLLDRAVFEVGDPGSLLIHPRHHHVSLNRAAAPRLSRRRSRRSRSIPFLARTGRSAR